ncbi:MULTISPECIES: acetylglutamate kinase [unclassified Campylobacter]|uniref:acetylglutamate kinase n=1 Tax=unclassified Campylobacter TaxID=2593542 RepID=UPI001237D392|nr:MULTISPECIES: acetylglutamate kinase [unclassified Campylobacter]KAA6224630.1 acetylglutamate kinase [Campylobacter sp. LR185c]KAA6228697.1 acetylglutamate kinase [Campylobacter sp. LR196d]KAA6229591.1 acetylglutamate kinase [Campylobacter sp. LR286c]KAA6233986.1 acetylglutamate kinase [Campylobacter sp. LR291e]KAA8603186.1 acetylglutamate kinase [Campylobacter sp. LR185c]
MEKYLEKASVLIQALPYIRKFNSKIILIKYGGSAMENEDLKRCVMQDIALLKLVGLKPVIVHGGGKDISNLCSKLGIKSEFKNGLRISDDETTAIAEMVLNRINKGLVQNLEYLGVKAIGICGKDGGLLKCVKKDENLGFVGKIESVNIQILKELLEKDFLPIIAPLGMDDNLNTYNINADDVACEVAKALKAEKLAFLSDIEGLYEDYSDKNSLISRIGTKKARELINKIQGGMLVKLNSCIDACENGVRRVHILDGRVKHGLLLEIFTDEGIGTLVVQEGQ